MYLIKSINAKYFDSIKYLKLPEISWKFYDDFTLQYLVNHIKVEGLKNKRSIAGGGATSLVDKEKVSAFFSKIVNETYLQMKIFSRSWNSEYLMSRPLFLDFYKGSF